MNRFGILGASSLEQVTLREIAPFKYGRSTVGPSGILGLPLWDMGYSTHKRGTSFPGDTLMEHDVGADWGFRA